MSELSVGLATFACAFGGAVAATYVRSWLPPTHLSKESQDVVRLGIGLVATMTALLLGLVTAASKNAFDTQDAALRNSAANLLVMDRDLARYGPETRPIRELIQRSLAARIEDLWPADGSAGTTGKAPVAGAPVEDAESMLVGLTAQTDAQRWFKSEALKLFPEIARTRWRVLQSGNGVPGAFLVAVIFWLTVTFASFGLYAPRNATVLLVLFVAAVSVAAAVFLVLEMDSPFSGVIRVKSDALRYALAHLNQ